MTRSDSDEQLSHELGKALEQIYATTPSREFDELLKDYRNVEEAFLARVTGNEFLRRETQRRVAELTLYSAIEKKCSFETCEKFLQDLEDLGFTNLERKSTVHLIYSRHCLEAGRHDEGINLLKPLEIELRETLSQSDIPVYRELLRTTTEVIELLSRTQ